MKAFNVIAGVTNEEGKCVDGQGRCGFLSTQPAARVSAWECISWQLNVNIRALSHLRYQALEWAGEWRRPYEKEEKK